MIIGKDYIGIGVGALIFNSQDEVFLAKRGMKAKNERGCWEFPGGTVEYGEKLIHAIKREILEEYGMQIEITGSLGAFDHILPEEKQHWVAVTFLAKYLAGTPKIIEPEKCEEIGWFCMYQLPSPLSQISRKNTEKYNLVEQSNT